MDPSHFNVDVRREGASLVVAPSGELDMATVGLLRAAIDENREDSRSIVLDLRGLDFIDTSGLQLIFEARKQAEAEGGRLTLVRGGPYVQKLFEITGLTDELTFVDDPREALGELADD